MPDMIRVFLQLVDLFYSHIFSMYCFNGVSSTILLGLWRHLTVIVVASIVASIVAESQV